jgi:hypothetical protein
MNKAHTVVDFKQYIRQKIAAIPADILEHVLASLGHRVQLYIDARATSFSVYVTAQFSKD